MRRDASFHVTQPLFTIGIQILVSRVKLGPSSIQGKNNVKHAPLDVLHVASTNKNNRLNVNPANLLLFWIVNSQSAEFNAILLPILTMIG